MCARNYIALILVLLFAWTADAVAREAEFYWKFASVAPKGIGWAKHIQDLVMPAVHEQSGGRLDIKWYWGGVMGDEEDYIKKMHIGQLDGMTPSAQGVYLAIPEMQVVSLPFLFRSWEEVDHIRRVMYPVFDEYAEKQGFKLMFWSDQDFDQIYSADLPFNSVEDFQKAKFVTWMGPLEEAVLNTLGSQAIPINIPEMPSAIRQGMVNAQIAPSLWVIGAQVYTAFKYICDLKIRYAPVGVILSLQAWQELPAEDQARFMAARNDVAIEFDRRIRQDSEKALAALINYGLKPVEMDPAMVARMQETCRSVWYEQADKLYPKALLDEILFQLDQYRKAKP